MFKKELMPKINQLSRLFKALAVKDFDAAESLAVEIALDEEKKGHNTAAQLLKGSLLPNGKAASDRDHREFEVTTGSMLLTGALSLRSSKVVLKDVMLESPSRVQLEEILDEVRHQAHLRSLGIRVRNKLIFFGPPGCGKSLTAQALANELRLPLYVVRFDSVIGAYLGQTATHLRQLFQFAETTQCVVLFDEIDALGKRRGSPTDVGELDRIVIALMQELELSEVRGLMIATSNLPDSLDKALWRRFDVSVKFPTPGKHKLTRFARSKARLFHLKWSESLRARAAKASNYAEAEKLVEDEARRQALRNL